MKQVAADPDRMPEKRKSPSPRSPWRSWRLGGNIYMFGDLRNPLDQVTGRGNPHAG